MAEVSYIELTCGEIRTKAAIMEPYCILPDGTRQDDCASCDYRKTNPIYMKKYLDNIKKEIQPGQASPL